MNSRIALTSLLILLATSQAIAQQVPDWQTKAGSRMSFEVASIRPTEPGKFTPPTFALDASDGYSNPTGNLLKGSFSLENYIEFAYKLWLSKDQRDAMLAHQPKWVSSENYVIEARAAGTPTKDQMRLMMQSLLADRFHLQVHFEKQQAPVLALRLIKPEKLGPSLHPHSEGPPCDTVVPAPAKSAAPDVTIFPPICNAFMASMSGSSHLVLIGSRDTTMSLIAPLLSSIGHTDRTVIDQTGLTGRYDVRMEFAPEQNTASSPGTDTTFLEALKEQLGLQLKSTTATLDVLVIDHLERPSEN